MGGCAHDAFPWQVSIISPLCSDIPGAALMLSIEPSKAAAAWSEEDMLVHIPLLPGASSLGPRPMGHPAPVLPHFCPLPSPRLRDQMQLF